MEIYTFEFRYKTVWLSSIELCDLMTFVIGAAQNMQKINIVLFERK